MKIAVAGGTGLVGKAVIKKLSQDGHEIVILTRDAKNSGDIENIQFVQWLSSSNEPVRELEDTDVIINLAGEPINSGRWTKERKKRILFSRLGTTEEIVKIINRLSIKPKTLINASAVGFYGSSETKIFDEDTSTPGTDFLAMTVKQWEETADKAADFDIRTVFCRFGVILDKKGGALPRMVLPYQVFAGGTVGSGNQWVSWIHIEDVVRGIIFAIENTQLQGPVNFTSPFPVRMKEFGKTIGSVLKRPHWLPVPAFVLKVGLGEMSDLVLNGQKVVPAKLENAHFSFQYPDLEPALKNILLS